MKKAREMVADIMNDIFVFGGIRTRDVSYNERSSCFVAMVNGVKVNLNSHAILVGFHLPLSNTYPVYSRDNFNVDHDHVNAKWDALVAYCSEAEIELD